MRRNYIHLGYLLLLMIPVFAVAQKDNSLKITASLTGLGASYEINPASVVYVEGGLSSAFTVTRFNVQSKLLLHSNENLKIKLGVEGAYMWGIFKVGGIFIDYYELLQAPKRGSFLFMPTFSLEGKIIGIELPVYVSRDFKTLFPIVGITLNVSKDEPAKKVPRKKKK
jgi:hypothetical protein